MRNRKGYTRVSFIDPAGSEVEVLRCDAAPHLGVTDANDPGWYWVYHLPKPALLCIVEGQDAALKLIEKLLPLRALAEPNPDEEVCRAAMALINSYRDGLVPKKRKTKNPPVELEPIYNPGVTPSRGVRVADKELAAVLGNAMAGNKITEGLFADTARKALDLAWRENIMAEVSQALHNDDEVPQQPYRLLDGTLCTWEGFRETYKRLIYIGNELQVQAIAMLDLADEMAGQDHPPTQEQRELWANRDELWIDLIAEGWWTHGECVAHFRASTPEQQERVRATLGYIGNMERGWGALGMKTFLRHQEIAEASKARRLVRYAREARRGTTV